MKKIKYCFLCAALAASIIFAVAAAPGGQDPLISLSFFQQEINALTANFNQQIQSLRTELTGDTEGMPNDISNNLMEQIRNDLRNELQKDMLELYNTATELNMRLAIAEQELLTAQGITARVEELHSGQVIFGYIGTRMILRGGAATSFSRVDNGLADLTSGNEIFHGEDVPVNHEMLISRSDHRGLLITSEVAWVLIQGEYWIEHMLQY